jgi:hypothetical protein
VPPLTKDSCPIYFDKAYHSLPLEISDPHFQYQKVVGPAAAGAASLTAYFLEKWLTHQAELADLSGAEKLARTEVFATKAPAAIEKLTRMLSYKERELFRAQKNLWSLQDWAARDARGAYRGSLTIWDNAGDISALQKVVARIEGQVNGMKLGLANLEARLSQIPQVKQAIEKATAATAEWLSMGAALAKYIKFGGGILMAVLIVKEFVWSDTVESAELYPLYAKDPIFMVKDAVEHDGVEDTCKAMFDPSIKQGAALQSSLIAIIGFNTAAVEATAKLLGSAH